ncbi:MAG: cbb3-type cytochrome c oxidase subunit I, partial [Gammaproteobacteria bacterium]
GELRPPKGTDTPPVKSGQQLVFADLIKAHAYASLILLFAALGFGLITAYKFVRPEFLTDISYLTWGRTRFDHVQGILFAWLMNAIFAFCYFVVPSLTERQLPSRRLGWALFWLWNIGVVITGWVSVLLGYSQSVEWHEFPFFVDVILVVCWLGFMVQFLKPYWQPPRKPLYVSSWYIILAFTFTPFAYVMGGVAPYEVSGIGGAAFSGLWIHDAVGILITPLALAAIYYVTPSMTGRPVYSHLLSMVGFWSLAFFYPLNGTHHYLFSPIPVAAQNIAITASVLMGFSVLLVVFNLLVSLRNPKYAITDLPAYKWIWMGVIFYLIVSVEGSLQALAPVQKIMHFSDWIVGHAHLALAGFATFSVIGGIVHMWPNVTGRVLSAHKVNISFWLLLSGLLLMVLDLSAAGVVQGYLWNKGAPWLESVTASGMFWWVRLWSGVLIAAGFIALLTALLTTRSRYSDVAGVPAGNKDNSSMSTQAMGASG